MSEVIDTVNEKEIEELIKRNSGTKSVEVPVYLEGKKIHNGIKFEISPLTWSNLVDVQLPTNLKSSTARQWLLQAVHPEHKDFLQKILAVTGMTESIFGEVSIQARPKISHDWD